MLLTGKVTQLPNCIAFISPRLKCFAPSFVVSKVLYSTLKQSLNPLLNDTLSTIVSLYGAVGSWKFLFTL